MIWFLFIGDLLVMLFMMAVAVWVFWRSPDSVIDHAGRIPLDDEAAARPPTAAGEN